MSKISDEWKRNLDLENYHKPKICC